jgi:hypothetical protein
MAVDTARPDVGDGDPDTGIEEGRGRAAPCESPAALLSAAAEG